MNQKDKELIAEFLAMLTWLVILGLVAFFLSAGIAWGLGYRNPLAIGFTFGSFYVFLLIRRDL